VSITLASMNGTNSTQQVSGCDAVVDTAAGEVALKLLAVLLCAALACAAQPASGQVVIGGGAGVWYGGYGPYPYGGYAPYVIIDPWAAGPRVPRNPDTWPSCYRYGRCSAADISAYRHRVERLERLAPSAPPDTAAWQQPRLFVPPPPTAEEEIRPEYRGSSVMKDEYRESGRPLDGRQ